MFICIKRVILLESEESGIRSQKAFSKSLQGTLHEWGMGLRCEWKEEGPREFIIYKGVWKDLRSSQLQVRLKTIS